MKLLNPYEFAKVLFQKQAEAKLDIELAVKQTVAFLLADVKPVLSNAPVRDAARFTLPTDSQGCIGGLQKLVPAQGGFIVALIGESHRNSVDEERAQSVVGAVNKKLVNPTVVVWERGMKYPEVETNAGNVNESNLFTLLASPTGFPITQKFDEGFTPKERSWVMAAYLVLNLALADADSAEFILLFFGENHADLLIFMDDVAKATAPYLLVRSRTYLLAPSSVQ